jgi:hypothetical protein
VRSRGQLEAFTLAALAALAAAGGACSKPKSFIVLDLYSADTRQISVSRVVVHVSQSPSLDKTLSYDVTNGPLVVNQVNRNDLSVSFTGGRSGSVELDVDVFDATGCRVGTAQGSSVIRQGDIVTASIRLEPLSCATFDGGVDAADGATFPGCDPADPGLVCTPTQTCQLNCGTNKGECTAGGTGGPGAISDKNKDCAPGLQCFDYSGAGCANPDGGTGADGGTSADGGMKFKYCLRYCNDDDTCSPGAKDAGTSQSASDGGAEGGVAQPSGPRSVCQGLVPCTDPNTNQQIITGYHTCTFACDPTQNAVAAGTTGCPVGLACLVIRGMDQVDCACAGASHKGTDGDDCTGGTDCAPGYICNMMGDTQKCRAICRCDVKDGLCTAANQCGGNKGCNALTNENTFGVCL